MTQIPRIALTGKLRSGKSEVARYLKYEYGFHEIAFGDSLKRVADDLFDDTDVEEYASIPIYRHNEVIPFLPEKEVIGYRKPRRRYQDFGQLMRHLDPSVWIRQAERSMNVWENQRDVKGIVVSDLRQPNEYEWAKENGFTIIRVSANEDTRLDRARKAGDNFTEDDLRHETEQHVDDFEADYDIWNDGEITELLRQIDEIMRTIMHDKGHHHC